MANQENPVRGCFRRVGKGMLLSGTLILTPSIIGEFAQYYTHTHNPVLEIATGAGLASGMLLLFPGLFIYALTSKPRTP